MSSIQELEDRKVELESEIQEKNKYINHVSDKISEAEGILASYKDKSSELDFIKGEITKHSESLATIKADYVSTNGLLINARRDMDVINAQIEDTKKVGAELDSLNAKKKELESTITSLIADIKSHNENIDSVVKKYSDTITDLQSKETSLISDINKNYINNKDITDSIARHNEILLALRSEITEKATEKENLTNDIKNLDNEMSIAKRIIESTRQNDIAEIGAIRSKAIEEVEVAKKDLDRREGEVSFKEKYLETRTETLRGIKTQLEDIHGKKLNIII